LKNNTFVDLNSFEEKLKDEIFLERIKIHLAKASKDRPNINLKVKTIMYELMTTKLINEFSWTGKTALNSVAIGKFVFQNFKKIIELIHLAVQKTEVEQISAKQIKIAIMDCLRRITTQYVFIKKNI
jgi:transcriptional regulator NrdR family protein